MKKILLLLAVMPMMLLSCSNELNLEEQIAEEEKALTDTEKQLLHQTPQFSEGIEENTSYYLCRHKTQDVYTEEVVDGWIIRKDGQGLVTQVLFDDITQQLPPSDGKSFLVQFFGEEVAAQFVKTDYDTRPENVEWFVQYCGDFEVSGYAFTYDDQGLMKRAGGAYYPTNGLSPNPTISSYVARMIFASYMGMSVRSVSEKVRLRIELIPDGTRFVPTLIYDVRLNQGKGVVYENRVAWVDAHSGRLLRAFVEFI